MAEVVRFQAKIWTPGTISAKIEEMEHLSWRRSDIRSDIKKLPMIWRITLYVAIAISALFMRYLQEAFHVPNNSWTLMPMGAIYVLVVFGALYLLRRRLAKT